MEFVRVRTERPEADLTTPITDGEASAMFRAAINLFEKWDVKDNEAAVLLDTTSRTFSRWKTNRAIGTVGRDFKTRLSNLMGVHVGLRYLFKEPERGYRWVKSPNAVFGGRSALDVMMNGEVADIIRVRRYLDAERSPW